MILPITVTLKCKLYISRQNMNAVYNFRLKRNEMGHLRLHENAPTCTPPQHTQKNISEVRFFKKKKIKIILHFLKRTNFL